MSDDVWAGQEADAAREASLLREERAVRGRLEREVADLRAQRDDLVRRLEQRTDREAAGPALPSAREREAERNAEALRVALERMDAAVAAARRAQKARDRAELRLAAVEEERLGGAVTGKVEQSTPVDAWAGERSGGRVRRVLLTALGALVVGGAAFAGGMAVEAGDRAEPRTADPQPARTTAAASTPAQPPVPCSSFVPGAELKHQVVCDLRGRTMVMTAGTRPVEIDGIGVRVDDVARFGDGLRVGVRVRNLTERPQRLVEAPRHLYVTVGTRRVYGRPGRTAAIAPDTAQNFTLTFPLGAPAIAALDANEGRFTFGVLPFGADAGKRESIRRLGVIRLTA